MVVRCNFHLSSLEAHHRRPFILAQHKIIDTSKSKRRQRAQDGKTQQKTHASYMATLAETLHAARSTAKHTANPTMRMTTTAVARQPRGLKIIQNLASKVNPTQKICTACALPGDKDNTTQTKSVRYVSCLCGASGSHSPVLQLQRQQTAFKT